MKEIAQEVLDLLQRKTETFIWLCGLWPKQAIEKLTTMCETDIKK